VLWEYCSPNYYICSNVVVCRGRIRNISKNSPLGNSNCSSEEQQTGDVEVSLSVDVPKLVISDIQPKSSVLLGYMLYL